MSKTLDRIAKVLNQAENASTPEEAATFMAKAQTLASLASIDLAVARAHTADKERREEVEKNRRVTVNPYNRKYNRDQFKDLYLVISAANDVRNTISEYVVFSTGFPSDIDVVEALFGRLSVQMVADCDAAMKAHAHEELRNEVKRVRVEIPDDERNWGGWDGSGWYDEDDWGKNPPPKTQFQEVPGVYEKRWFTVVDGRTYRANFYAGFVHSTEVRLMAARQEARIKAGAEEESSGTALVLKDKTEEVEGAYQEVLKELNARGVYRGAQVSQHSWRGRDDGAEAARRARYDTDVEVGAAHRKELS